MRWHQILGLLYCLFFLHSSLPFVSPLCPPDQRDALLLFKNSLLLDCTAADSACEYDGVLSYPKANSWNQGIDCCSWDGVMCDGVTGNIIGLDLRCNCFHGALHSNSSLFLPTLEVLRLSCCNLTEIPYFLNSLKGLTHLDLSYNRISGEIPRWFWGISRDTLETLDLSQNLLEGGIQQFHWKRLSHIYLQNNSFQGPLPIPPPSTSYFDASNNGFTGKIPSSISQLSSLESLYLSNNNLIGNMPPCFGNITNLWTINLSSNKFQGPLPIPPPSTFQFNASYNGFNGEISSSFCQVSTLRNLDLSGNNLSGNLPPCLGNLTNLKYLDLSNNKFQGPLPIPSPSISNFMASCNGFTGEIPSLICQLSSLWYLDLSNNNLYGNMPPCFGNITILTYLNLTSNKLQGSLPRSLVKCVDLLLLDLSYNEFNDIFPHWLEAPHLEHLHLQSNKFHSTINLTAFGLSFPALRCLIISNNNFIGWWPTEFFLNTSLAAIDLSNNNFVGPIPLPSPVTNYYSIASNNITGNIPSLVCNASRLEIIDMSNNGISGSLPQCLINFNTVLSVLNLQMNLLEGTIPQSFSYRNSLATIDLSQNRFEGTLPRSLVKCRHLEVLDLGENHIEDTFPRWLGTLPELKVLVLRSNNFMGLLNIPRGAHLFPKLRILDLSNNYFGGPLPANLIANLRGMMNGENEQDKSMYMTRFFRMTSYENSITVTMKGLEIELVKILSIFTTIDLSHNSFQGDIPGVIGHLHSLKGLNLSHNYLTGSIPLTLGNLTDLEWLDLSANKLSGAIPKKLGDLAFLGYLNLSKNQLIGRIPQDKQLSTFSSESFSGNPDLCGAPLPKACSNNAKPSPPSSSPTFDHERHESLFKQKTMWMGFASGTVIGISAAYIVFETGRPKWLAQGMRMLEKRAAKWMEKPKWKAIKFYGQ